MAKNEQVNVGVKVTGADKAAGEINNLNKSVKKLDKQAGLAGATLIQVGNGIGDIRYGFGAIANNISQVGSLFGMLATEAGGVTKAFKDLRKAIVGPVGVMLAFQAIVAAIDFFASRTDNAKESTDKLTDAIAGTAGQQAKLDVLAKTYKTAAEGSNEFKGALQDLKKLGFDPVTQSIDDFIKKQKELIVLQATAGVFKSQLEELIKEREAIRKELNNRLKSLPQGQLSPAQLLAKGIFGEVPTKEKIIKEYDSALKDVEDAIKEVRDKYSNVVSDILGISGSKITDEDDDPKTPKRAVPGAVSELTQAGITGTGEDSSLKLMEERLKKEEDAQREHDMIMEGLRNEDLMKTRYTEEAKTELKMAGADAAMKIFGMLKNIDGLGRDGMKAMLIAEHGAAVAKQLFSFNQANLAATAHAATMGPYGAAYLTKSLALNKINLGVGLAGTGVALANGLTAIGKGGGAGSTPNASAAAGSVLSPQFNIVGQGQQAGLAEAIGANVATAVAQEPIKAYVVANDVTTQQEIDRRSDDLSSI